MLYSAARLQVLGHCHVVICHFCWAALWHVAAAESSPDLQHVCKFRVQLCPLQSARLPARDRAVRTESVAEKALFQDGSQKPQVGMHGKHTISLTRSTACPRWVA